MPLQQKRNVKKEAFVRDTVVYVDSSLNKSSSDTDVDFTFRPQQPINDVVSLEVVGLNFDQALTGLFSAGGWIDLSMDVSTLFGDSTKTLSVEMPPCKASSTYSDVMEVLASVLNNGIRQKYEDGEWITFYTDVESTNGLTDLTIEVKQPSFELPGVDRPSEQIGFNSSGSVSFFRLLFRTGEHADESAGAILGFEKEDYASTVISDDGTIVTYQITSPNQVILNPYRYLDILIDQVLEFVPLFRTYVDEENVIRKQEVGTRSRLLTQPIRKLDELTFRIRLPGGLKPRVGFPIFINLRVFYLNEGDKVPTYLRDRLKIQ